MNFFKNLFESKETRLNPIPAETMHHMVLVEGGTFMMGSDDGYPEEMPLHKVTLSSFLIGKYEVTQ